MTETAMVANIPNTNPDALNAAGMDKIPVPNEAFRRWVKVSQFLKKQKNTKLYNLHWQIVTVTYVTGWSSTLALNGS